MSAQAMLFGLLVGVLACGWSVHAGLLRQQLRRARRDRLTGLNRREQFHERAQRALRRRGGCVGLLDLDGLKQINDTHGHAAGDAVLAAAADRLRQVVGTDASIGRLGGDEFAFLAPSGDAGQLAAQVRHAVRQPLVVHTGHGYVWLRAGVSVGTTTIAACRRSNVEAALARALASADAAMYRSKPRARAAGRRPRPRRSRPSSGPGGLAAEQPALDPQK